MDAEALTGHCPECQVDLVRVDGGDRHHPLHYDTCESCGGIFLESEFKDAHGRRRSRCRRSSTSSSASRSEEEDRRG